MIAQPRRASVAADELDVERGSVHRYTRSKIAAMPCPPPMQSDARP